MQFSFSLLKDRQEELRAGYTLKTRFLIQKCSFEYYTHHKIDRLLTAPTLYKQASESANIHSKTLCGNHKLHWQHSVLGIKTCGLGAPLS
jgi:hypothetical protein